MNLRQESEKSPLIFGSAVDEAWNELLLGKGVEAALTEFDRMWAPYREKEVNYSKSDLDKRLIPDDTPEKEQAWQSLRRKGELMICAYADEILPRIREVYAVQGNIDVANQNGDVLTGKIDLICEWEDGRIILFDNKTTSVKYTEDSVKESDQLGTYFDMVKDQYGLDACGYITANKYIKKNDVVTIDVVIGNVDELVIEKAYEDYDEVLRSIKAAQFPQNFSSCINKFGKCQYYDYCHNGDKTGLVEKKKER